MTAKGDRCFRRSLSNDLVLRVPVSLAAATSQVFCEAVEHDTFSSLGSPLEMG